MHFTTKLVSFSMCDAVFHECKNDRKHFSTFKLKFKNINKIKRVHPCNILGTLLKNMLFIQKRNETVPNTPKNPRG